MKTSLRPFFHCSKAHSTSCLTVVNHQPEFTAHCIKPEADKALMDGALAMAWTAIDLASDQALRDQLINRPATS